jgi:glycogen synthase
LNIVFISAPYPPKSRGGAGSYVHNLTHALAEAGHTVQVIARCPLDQDHETCDGSIRVHWVGPFVIRMLWRRPLKWLRLYENFPAVGDWIGWSIGAARKAFQLHKENKIDILDARDHLAQGYAATYLRNIPLVVRIHSPMAVNLIAKGSQPQKDHWLGFRFERQALIRADACTAPSKTYADFLRDFWKLGELPITIIPNPVNEQKFASIAPSKRKKNRVTFVGRLTPVKGIQELLDAIPLVLQKQPDTHFQIVGPDEGVQVKGLFNSYAEYFQVAYGPEIAQRVSFIGWVDRETLPEIYQSSLIAVNPSSGSDNFPNTVLEAMSCGCAVIGSHMGGIPEMIEHGKTGLLVKPGDVTELANAIIRLLAHPEQALAMGAEARRVVEQRFAQGRVADQMLDLYTKVISSRES